MTVNFQMLGNAALMWNALTWVDEKGETVFDPSAAGDEAECQRKEIDRLERALLLRGMVMCPRGPVLERVRPLDGRSGVVGEVPVCTTVSLPALG